MSERLVIPTKQDGVTLREIDIASFEDIFEYSELARKNQHFLRQHSYVAPFEVGELMTRVCKRPDVDTSFSIRRDDEMVGSIGAWLLNQEASVYYWLDQRAQGNGYATVAVSALSGHIRENLGLPVGAWTFPRNERSQRVLLGAGFEETTSENGRKVFALR